VRILSRAVPQYLTLLSERKASSLCIGGPQSGFVPSSGSETRAL